MLFRSQYEFVLREWVNDSAFAGAVRLHPKSKDPMIGTQDPAESLFAIPQADGAPPIKITGFSSFIATKAAAYCFLPSITALRFISKLGLGNDMRPVLDDRIAGAAKPAPTLLAHGPIDMRQGGNR